MVNARGRQDPYQILGVDPKASDDEVRNTYHRRVQNYHPDVIQGAGLPREFVDLANMQMARINDAFERIQTLRGEQGLGKPPQSGRGQP